MASRIEFFLIIHHVRHRGNRGSAPRGFSFIFPKKSGLAVDKILTAVYHRRDKITGSARWISEAGTRGVRRDCTWNGVPPPHRRFPSRNAVTAPRNLIKDFSTATACTILPQSGFLPHFQRNCRSRRRKRSSGVRFFIIPHGVRRCRNPAGHLKPAPRQKKR